MNHKILLQNLASHSEVISNRNFFKEIAKNVDENTKVRVTETGFFVDTLIPIWKGLLGYKTNSTFFPWSNEDTKQRLLMECYNQSMHTNE